MRTHTLVDAVHVLFMVSPVLVLAAHLAGKDVRRATVAVMLAFSVVPHIWHLAKNCPLTALSRKGGGLAGAKTSSAFSEIYFGWLYFPAIRLSGHQVNDQTMNVACSVHHLVYLALLAWIISRQCDQ